MVFEPSAVVFHYHDRNLSEYLQRKFGIGYWKAFMLHWIPEKTFSDSHTAPTQRVEILLLAMLLATIPFIVIWPFYASIFFLIYPGCFPCHNESFPGIYRQTRSSSTLDCTRDVVGTGWSTWAGAAQRIHPASKGRIKRIPMPIDACPFDQADDRYRG